MERDRRKARRWWITDKIAAGVADSAETASSAGLAYRRPIDFEWTMEVRVVKMFDNSTTSGDLNGLWRRRVVTAC